ncbi:uncharacterized protein JCM15063_006264 [Sporobolomyces koalae]|uniref:uncharacterized protein n=1 Tax=Sporobolomyces koalae TaxID=500713 RepID=UPI00316C7C81
MSLIVAGAPGQDRPEYVFALIELAQSRLPSRSPQRPCKRRRIASPPPPLAPPYLDTPVRQLPDLPDFLLPLSEPTHAEPFVVRSAATDWEAAARWKDLEYLQKVGGGRGRVVPVEVGQDYTKAGWGQEIVAWDAFLRETFSHTAQEERHDYYLAQHSLLTQFPRLSADFPIPSLVYSQPAPLEDQYPDYEPPKSQDGWVMNAWLGKGGTVSQAHTDPYWNCYVQVVGSKWVWIAPPCVSVHMSAFGSSSQPLGDLAEDGQDCTTATEYMTNTSTIDVTLPIPKTSPSFTTFETHVRPHAQQVVLGPGDLLVMPPGWWHAMKSLETSFSISTWF